MSHDLRRFDDYVRVTLVTFLCTFLSATLASDSVVIERELLRIYSELSAYCDKVNQTTILRSATYSLPSVSTDRCVASDGRYREVVNIDTKVLTQSKSWSDGSDEYRLDSDGHLSVYDLNAIHRPKLSIPYFLFGKVDGNWYLLQTGEFSGMSAFLPSPQFTDPYLVFYERVANSSKSEYETQRIGVSKQDGLIRYAESTARNGSKSVLAVSAVRINDAVTADDYKVDVSIWARVFNSNSKLLFAVGIGTTSFLLGFGFGAIRAYKMRPNQVQQAFKQLLKMTSSLLPKFLWSVLVLFTLLLAPMFVGVPLDALFENVMRLLRFAVVVGSCTVVGLLCAYGLAGYLKKLSGFSNPNRN